MQEVSTQDAATTSNNKPQRKGRFFRNLAWVAAFVLTFLSGALLTLYYSFNRMGNSGGKIEQVMGLLQRYYVDSVNLDSLSEKALPLILAQLDPHSTYLSPEENKTETESLDGSFAGIGVQFNTLLDTVIVVRVIEGGPSERAGIKAGDRILRADTTNLVKDSLSSDQVMKALKGPENSVVRLQIKRGSKTFVAPVVRGLVPVTSIDAAYMIRPHVLYVRLNKWGAQTPQEFQQAVADNLSQGVERIMIDLRDNGGGYLQAATALASSFLPDHSLLVYNQGLHYKREDFYSEGDGRWKSMPLIVLVNEASASSSEIFSGAMQDLDRALIVGRRTFGKGLVQLPFDFTDGSVVRLTVARYHTPSGRSIQKSYAKGYEAYAEDLENRYLHGEFYSADSISRPDTTRYYTRLGRVVYGGGGITPDIFTPRDSAGINPYYIRLMSSGTIQRYAFMWADSHRAELQRLNDKQLMDYLTANGESIVQGYASYASTKGVAQRPGYLQESMTRLKRDLTALIADMLGMDKNLFYRMRNNDDPEVQTALTRLMSPAWRPVK